MIEDSPAKARSVGPIDLEQPPSPSAMPKRANKRASAVDGSTPPAKARRTVCDLDNSQATAVDEDEGSLDVEETLEAMLDAMIEEGARVEYSD